MISKGLLFVLMIGLLSLAIIGTAMYFIWGEKPQPTKVTQPIPIGRGAEGRPNDAPADMPLGKP